MKTNRFFNIAAATSLLLGGTACSSDYLDLEPQGTLSYEEVLTNAQGATLAVHGICNSMYKQYSALYDYYWFNGEPWLSMYYGEVMGQDYISLFWFRSYPGLVNWSQMNQQSQGAQVAWSYCYGLISQANNVITFAPKELDANGEVVYNNDGNPVPDFSEVEDPEEYEFRYAQALTLRAHAYSRLMQIYAPRWDDRYNDDMSLKLTVPLRLEYVEPEGNMDCPLSDMPTVMDQIYADLNQALELYKSSGLNRDYDWEPNDRIAMGIYARAALLKNDYVTAQKMAHDAWDGYEIMTAQDYLAGFAEPTSEWMWTNSGQAQGLYYASFGATYACNGAYPCGWGSIGAGAINNDLLEACSSTDQRRVLYFAPKTVLGASNKAAFWSDGCNSTTMNVNSPSSSLHSEFVKFCQSRYNNVKDKGWDPPYTYTGYPLSEGTTIVTAQFGAQFKFWGTDNYSTSYFPFMRASEMLLIEAESAYQNGDESTANKLLNKLNALRINNYRDKTYSGFELLEQIKFSRRFELWGEGFNWFDYKRWNEPIYRNGWVKNNQSSGNWPSSVAGEYGVDKNRGWRWRIPSVEYRYNHAIDQAEANANDGSGDVEGDE